MSDNNFEKLSKTIFETYLKFNPQTGSNLGLHEYDGKICIPTAEGIAVEAEAYKDLLGRLESITAEELSPEEIHEYNIAKWGLESSIFDLEIVQSYRNNPMHYAFMFSEIHNYISREYAPFEIRLEAVIKLISAIPEALKAAEDNLNPVLPEVLCKYAVHFSKGYEDFFKNDLLNEIKRRGVNDQLISKYNETSSKAIAAFERYMEIVNQRSSDKDTGYQMGKEKYENMMRIKEHVYLSAEELKKRSLEELRRLKTSLKNILKDNGYEGKLEQLEHDHPDEKNLIKETDNMLGNMIDFIRNQKIVSLPDKLNCIVTEMPRYMNFGFAAMNTAGPYEKSDESFYYVNLPEPEWDEEKKEEWMTQFSYPTLTLTSIHEAYPGHYTHFLNANMNSSRLSNLFMSYSYVEGWAHYSEEMMIEQGYGGGDFKIEIGMLIEALIRCCRFIVSIGIHCENMSIDEAKQFFLDNAYMADITAQQEAERGAFDPGYLNYTLGKILLKQLRDKYFKHFDGKKTLFDFHNQIVRLGAPTFDIAEKYILSV